MLAPIVLWATDPIILIRVSFWFVLVFLTVYNVNITILASSGKLYLLIDYCKKFCNKRFPLKLSFARSKQVIEKVFDTGFSKMLQYLARFLARFLTIIARCVPWFVTGPWHDLWQDIDKILQDFWQDITRSCQDLYQDLVRSCKIFVKIL